MVAQDKELSVLRVVLQYLSLLDCFLMWCIRQAGLYLNGTYASLFPLLFLPPMLLGRKI